MTTWLDFERKACAYLTTTYGTNGVVFDHRGGSVSGESDILVHTPAGNRFFVEAKMPTAQSGQFVILDQGDRFLYSAQNEYASNIYADAIIDIINHNYALYKQVGTAAIPIDINPTVFAHWIMEHYRQKQVKYVITTYNNQYVIFPIERFSAYFRISANVRRKKSGSSDLPKIWQQEVLDICQAKFSMPAAIQYQGKKAYLSIAHPIPDKYQLSGANHAYQFNSVRPGMYQVRKLSNTNNPNVIFSVTTIHGQYPADLEQFQQALV